LTPAILAGLPYEHQVSLLGEKIFPLIERVQPEHAGKITGMLLERYSSTPEELLNLLNNPELLNENIREGVEVLARASEDGQ